MKPPQRILLIQLRALGDVLLTTPALRVLKKHFPAAEIDFVTNPGPAEVLAGNPYLHEVLVYPFPRNDVRGALRFAWALRAKKYDLVIDFLGTPATALMALLSGAALRIGYNLRIRKYAYNRLAQDYRGDAYNALTKFSLLKPLGIMEQEVGLDLVISPEADQWATNLFIGQHWGEGQVVALAPAAKAPARVWRPERFAQVAQWLHDQGFTTLFLWGPGEEEYVKEVVRQTGPFAVLSPPTTLLQVSAILKRCRLLVTNCSGMKHFAVAVGTPTLAINGPTDPRAWTPPQDPRHQYVQASLDCLVCGKKQCEPLKCMDLVIAEQVIEKIQQAGLLRIGEAAS